jgi:hypothetical protein
MNSSAHVSSSGKPEWKFAAYTGLIVGTIFLLATGGDPWGFSIFVKPTVMGREIIPATPRAGELNLSFIALHYALSLLFSFVMAPFLNKVFIQKALFLGLLFGLLFYGLNRIAFSLLPIATKAGETRALFTNVAFALVATSVYRGFMRGRAN